MVEKQPHSHWVIRTWKVFLRAALKFHQIDGSTSAASFGYYAIFALVPLILLFITIGSLFLNQDDVARHLIRTMELYVPFRAEDKIALENGIHEVLIARKGASALAVLALIWSSSQLFHTIVHGVNRAWDTVEYPWWHVPVKSFVLLGLTASAFFIGILVPVIINSLRHMEVFEKQRFTGFFHFVEVLLPSLVLLYGLTMFYKFVPRRRPLFSEVIVAAMATTFLLQVCRLLFEIYVYQFGNFNALYGTLAVIAVLLMWIYLSGVIIIYGGCLCAAQKEVFGKVSAAG
jgi:Ca2+-transporting ATPase